MQLQCVFHQFFSIKYIIPYLELYLFIHFKCTFASVNLIFHGISPILKRMSILTACEILPIDTPFQRREGELDCKLNIKLIPKVLLFFG